MDKGKHLLEDMQGGGIKGGVCGWVGADLDGTVGTLGVQSRLAVAVQAVRRVTGLGPRLAFVSFRSGPRTSLSDLSWIAPG